jgi:beta-mannosidase
MPPVGIWDSVFLRATGEVSLGEVAIHTNLSEDRAEASISVVSDLRGPGPTSTAVVVEILLDGMPVCGTQDSLTVSGRETSLVQSLRIPRVQLWWPNGAGRQPLYEARLTLKDPHGGVLDLRSIEFGVRSVEMRPNEGAPPDSLPYTLVVNGRRLFVKGCNWVPADLLYGGVDRSRLNRLLVMAQAAGVNMLRVWGGGLLETETFYQICDRLGILVWQEFPQCSSGLDNCPPSDEAYLDRIRAVAPGMIARRRNHPCLALWCGGNELAGADSLPIGSEHPALAELRQLAAAHDPLRAWLPASPSGPTFASDPARRGEMHDVHGPWHYLGPAEHSAFYNDIDPQLHSEFGCEGTAPLETLRWLAGDTGDEVLWPADRANPFWMHHGGESWLRPERVETAFGAPAVLEDFVRASQFLQAEGIRYAIESNRRRKWRCSGTMPWQFNEPWPNAICTSLVDYFGRPKPAYWTMRRAYAPLHVSLAYRTLVWSAEREFQADVWLHNSGAAVSLINIAVTITALDGRALHQENLAAEAPSEAAERVGDVAWRFPADFQDVFLVHLEVIDEEGDRLAENGYVHSRAPAPPFASLLRAPPTSLELSRDRGVTVRNAGRAPALVVIVEASDDGGPRVGESWFVFPPGETRHMEVGSSGPARARAWNAPAVTA